jgi:hypothetical protein
MTDASKGFAAFRDRVLDDPALIHAIDIAMDHEAYMAHLVEKGRELGFDFTAEEVRAARQAGHAAFLAHWTPGQ